MRGQVVHRAVARGGGALADAGEVDDGGRSQFLFASEGCEGFGSAGLEEAGFFPFLFRKDEERGVGARDGGRRRQDDRST